MKIEISFVAKVVSKYRIIASDENTGDDKFYEPLIDGQTDERNGGYTSREDEID